MRIHVTRKTKAEITDRFEAALDFTPSLDPVPFYIKRQAVEEAAKLVAEYLEAQRWKKS